MVCNKLYYLIYACSIILCKVKHKNSRPQVFFSFTWDVSKFNGGLRLIETLL